MALPLVRTLPAMKPTDFLDVIKFSYHNKLIREYTGHYVQSRVVTYLHFLPQLFLQRQWPSTLQLAAGAGRVIRRGCMHLSLPRCVVSREVPGVKWLE